MKKNILILIMVTTGLFSCGQAGKLKPNAVEIKTSDSVKSVQNKKAFNDKYIDSKYEYANSTGASLIIQNGLPKGGMKYTDRNGDIFNYVYFGLK